MEITFNKRAMFDYEILSRHEAGLMLLGHEVKSIKTGHISLKTSFITSRGDEFYLTNAIIPPYPFAGKLSDYDPERSRKLLMHKSELRSFLGKMRVQGLTLVPIRVYTKKRLIKLEFALAKGKKKFDKRADIQKKEAKRKIERELRNF